MTPLDRAKELIELRAMAGITFGQIIMVKRRINEEGTAIYMPEEK